MEARGKPLKEVTEGARKLGGRERGTGGDCHPGLSCLAEIADVARRECEDGADCVQNADDVVIAVPGPWRESDGKEYGPDMSA